MKQKVKWAFIFDKDEFVRLSLNKILKKYGFEVEEIQDLSQLEKRKKEVEGGMIVADVEVDVLEKEFALLKKWNDRFILMTPLISEEITNRLKKMGIRHIIKKPVDPKLLRKAIRGISFPGEIPSSGKKREDSHFVQKGGDVL